MRFTRDYLFENVQPSVHIGANIVKLFTVDFDVQWGSGWAIQNRMENYVFAYAV
jgi:hypothetical protein